jgi:hypothetical protein
MSSLPNLLECVHGLYWQTCHLCIGKTEQEVQAEWNAQRAENRQVKYDYQEFQQDDIVEADLAFDIEDSDY